MTAYPETSDGDAVEMVRSQEQVRVSTARVPVRRARLERFEVTEMQTITVPVVREDVRIVYEPIDPSQHVSGQISAQEAGQPAVRRPLVLTQERVIVTTERVPVELVSLVVETVTEKQTVTADVRSEQITLASMPAVHPQVGNATG